jgi:transcriptional regulator with XRE-family HTH domain
MSVPTLLSSRLKQKDMAVYALHKATGYKISHSYLNKILNGDVNQVSVEKLRLLAKAFNDPIEVWLEAAGYLDGIESVEQAIEQRYGPLFKNSKMAAILTKKGVIDILEILATVPDEKMAGLAEFIKTYAKGLQ